jgi:hypothetical protein
MSKEAGMPKPNLERLGGLAAILGGLVISCFNLVEFLAFSGRPFSELAQSPGWMLFQIFGLVGITVVVLGLLGLYTAQAARAGWFGLTAFVLALLGTLQYYGIGWAGAFLMPAIGRAAPAVLDQPDTALSLGVISTILVSTVGWAAFAIATLRARLFPRWAPIAMLVAVGFSLVAELTKTSVPIGPVVLGIAIAGMGYALFTRDSKGVDNWRVFSAPPPEPG